MSSSGPGQVHQVQLKTYRPGPGPYNTLPVNFLRHQMTSNHYCMTSNNVPLILAFKMTFKMTLKMAIKTFDFRGLSKKYLKGTSRECLNGI